MIIFLSVLLSFGLKANESLDVNYNNMKLGVGYVSSLKENKEKYLESQGFEFSIGYKFESKWLLETGFTDFTNKNEIQPNDIFLRSKKNWQVSDYASIYAGFGLSYLEDNFNPTINMGINYHLNNDWYVDVGYQSLISNRYDDVYSFLISLNYNFSVRFKEEQSSIYYEPISVIADTDEVNISSSEMNLQEKKSKKYYDYYVVIKYDNLTKIGKKLNIPLGDVILANPQLSLRNRSIDLIYPGERIFYPIKQ
jgi:LysM repeat protein